MRWALVWMPTLLVASSVAAAPGDIFGYTDTAGVVHLTNVPTDSRFELVARAAEELSATPTAIRHPQNAANFMLRAGNYAHVIDRAAQIANVQPALLRAVIAVESAFNPTAVSPAGARGLMQLHPTTARRYGVNDSFDPEQNVGAGARYLRDLLRRYGNDLELALAAYNAGEDAVDRAGRHIPPYRETREYVPAVMRLYREFLANPVRST